MPEDHVAEEPLRLDMWPDRVQQVGGFTDPAGLAAGEDHLGQEELGYSGEPSGVVVR